MSKLTEIQEKIAIRVEHLYNANRNEPKELFGIRIETDEEISRLIEQAYNYGWNNAMDRVQVPITKK